MDVMRVLIAPNAFKNSLDAESTARAIRDGLEGSRLSCVCECHPVGDGGDGTADLIIKRMGGHRVEGIVHDPLGRMLTSSFGLIDGGKTAVIEMADASGLRLLKSKELDPLHAHSLGTGEQIRLALGQGVTRIIIGMGGSATVDGGTGILKALGVRFLGKKGEELPSLPGDLARLATIDVSRLDHRIAACEIIVLCDVDNLLLGEQGAAAVFGPQKGATPATVVKLEASLRQLAAVTLRQTGKDISSIPYGGTAGGAAAGLYALLNARLVNGIDYFLQLTGFDKALEQADLVITGEGSIDAQTLQGKGPFGVAYKAKARGLPVLAIAGKVPLINDSNLQQYFDVLLPIGHEPADLPTALKSTTENIIRTSREIGNLLAITRGPDSI